MSKFASLMHYSMLKTFANKYRTKTRKIKKKYFRDGRFTVIYKTKSGMKESVFYRGPFIRKDKPNVPQADILPAYKRYDRPNRIAAKLRSKTCELCGQYTNDVEIHQVKRLKSLSGEYEWEKVMLKNRRKTLAVCPACHREIHGNDYTMGSGGLRAAAAMADKPAQGASLKEKLATYKAQVSGADQADTDKVKRKEETL